MNIKVIKIIKELGVKLLEHYILGLILESILEFI
jgi:hypothetical protein